MIIECLQCGQKNRVASNATQGRAYCGKCKSPLNYSGRDDKFNFSIDQRESALKEGSDILDEKSKSTSSELSSKIEIFLSIVTMIILIPLAYYEFPKSKLYKRLNDALTTKQTIKIEKNSEIKDLDVTNQSSEYPDFEVNSVAGRFGNNQKLKQLKEEIPFNYQDCILENVKTQVGENLPLLHNVTKLCLSKGEVDIPQEMIPEKILATAYLSKSEITGNIGFRIKLQNKTNYLITSLAIEVVVNGSKISRDVRNFYQVSDHSFLATSLPLFPLTVYTIGPNDTREFEVGLITNNQNDLKLTNWYISGAKGIRSK